MLTHPFVRVRPLSSYTRWRVAVPLAMLGAVPLVVYFHPPQYSALLLMYATFWCVQALFALRVAATATLLMTKLWRVAGGNTDLLTLAGIEARDIPRFTWWTTVRLSLPDALLLVLPRLGLAYGLVQFWHTFSWSGLAYVFRGFDRRLPAFSYTSHNGCYWESCIPLVPTVWQVLLAALLLALLAVAELAFMAALATVWAALLRRRGVMAAGAAWLARGALAVGAIALLLSTVVRPATIYTWRNTFANRDVYFYVHRVCPVAHSGFEAPNDHVQRKALDEQFANHCPRFVRLLTAQRVLETGHVALSTWWDGGPLLASNLMRPLSAPRDPDNQYDGGPYFGWHADPYNAWMPRPRVWPFVLRNAVGGVLALLLNALGVWVLLWLARRTLAHRAAQT